MKPSGNLATYLLYILLSAGFVATAATIQIYIIYGTHEARMFVVPVTVGILFGLLIAKIRILQKEQKSTLKALKTKDSEIRELNQGLEKKVEAKTHELSEQRLYTESILNAQNSIVIITDGYTLIKANKAFFRYIDDFVSVDDFKSKYNCICDLFVEKEGYLLPDINDSRWTTYILNNPDIAHKAFITYNGHDYIFSVHAKKFIYGDTQKIIATFEDITQLMDYEEQLETKIAEEIEASRKKDAIIYQQSRFAAVGEAMQSVSHHWRQPLSALSLMIQDIQEAKDFNELDQAYMKEFTSRSLELIRDMSLIRLSSSSRQNIMKTVIFPSKRRSTKPYRSSARPSKRTGSNSASTSNTRMSPSTAPKRSTSTPLSVFFPMQPKHWRPRTKSVG